MDRYRGPTLGRIRGLSRILHLIKQRKRRNHQIRTTKYYRKNLTNKKKEIQPTMAARRQTASRSPMSAPRLSAAGKRSGGNEGVFIEGRNPNPNY